jgi:hypothetical protein
MRKRRFRIISMKNGENTIYDTRIKTWFGWTSFSVYYDKHILHVASDPLDKISGAYERIQHYCREKGYHEKDIVITETTG